MLLVVGAVAVGLVVGRLRPPWRVRHLAPPAMRGVPSILAAIAAIALADQLDGGVALALALGGRAALVVAALANLHVTGAGVLAIGTMFTASPMALNGSMPVRPGALVAAGVVPPSHVHRIDLDGPRHLERDDDVLPWLGDALPIRPLNRVASFGDLITCAGVGAIVANAVRRRAGEGAPLPPIDLRMPDPGRLPPPRLRPPLQPAGSSRRASPDHDWGLAPRPSPVSGSHHSARPERRAPVTVGAATHDAPARASR